MSKSAELFVVCFPVWRWLASSGQGLGYVVVTSPGLYGSLNNLWMASGLSRGSKLVGTEFGDGLKGASVALSTDSAQLWRLGGPGVW
jgi:hypothetical protein